MDFRDVEITLWHQKLVLPDAQVARDYGTEITQIPCKNCRYVTAPKINCPKRTCCSQNRFWGKGMRPGPLGVFRVLMQKKHFSFFAPEIYPDPLNLVYFYRKKKRKGNPKKKKKTKVWLFAEPLKSLEKEGEMQKKENRKKKTRNSKKTRIGGSG